MALTTSLISFWEFDEATGSGNRNDAHSTNHLTASGSLTRLSGVNGAFSVFLDSSTSDTLSRSTNAALETGNIDWSIAGWFAFNAWSDYYTIIGKWPTTENQREYLLYYYHDIDKLELTARKGDDTGYVAVDSVATIAASDQNWHFYVIGFNSALQKTFISLDNETLILSSTTLTMHVGNGLFQFGGNLAGGVSDFSGWVDQTGFWKRTLTIPERTWLYNAGAGRSYAEIVAESAPSVTLMGVILM